MRILIDHETRYRYARPVLLDPHRIRLRPQDDASQRLARFRLTLEPPPAGSAWCVDAEGAPMLQAWFNAPTRSLRIHARAEVVTLRRNPYDCLPLPGADSLPPRYSPLETAALAPCLERLPCDAQDDVVGRFAREVAEDATPPGRLIPFLDALCQRIFQTVRKTTRREPGVQRPVETLAMGEGACRDAALLFMDACRAMGAPARFVSGYQRYAEEQDACCAPAASGGGEHGDAGDRPDKASSLDETAPAAAPEHELHAWAEAFVPGCGWRGYDPTHGLAVSDGHIVLAASSQAALTAPVEGDYRHDLAGEAVASELTHRVSLTPLP